MRVPMPSALRLWILGVGLAALGLGLGGWMRLDREVQRDRFPPTPGWVDARGQVDLARFPTRIPVVDAQGRHGGWIDLREEPFFMVPLWRFAMLIPSHAHPGHGIAGYRLKRALSMLSGPNGGAR